MFRKRLWRFLPGPSAGWVAKLMTKEAEYVPMAPGTRDKVRAMFAADNGALAKWLGRDLSVWDA